MNEFEVLMKQEKSQPLAICLTETWLNDHSNTKCINLDSYQEIAKSNRNTSEGGGVGIFVRMDLQQTIIKNFGCISIQILTVKINTKNGKSFLLTVIYIKPNTIINEISKTFQMFFKELTREPEQLHIVCGDFKIYHSSKNIKLIKLKDIFSSYNLSNMSDVGYTRESAKSRTNIEVVYLINHLILEKMVFKIRDKLGRLMSHF